MNETKLTPPEKSREQLETELVELRKLLSEAEEGDNLNDNEGSTNAMRIIILKSNIEKIENLLKQGK